MKIVPKAMKGSRHIWILNGILLLLTSVALEEMQNVALNKGTTQSSQGHHLGDAYKAVDGLRMSRFNYGSCTRTNTESNPWWRVDLEIVYKIRAITITNTDDSPERLDGAEIWIGPSTDINATTSFRCAVVSHIPSENTVYFPCSAVEARYVTVFLPGDGRILSLCEVEVYTVDYVYPVPNVALNGDVAQSSTLSPFAAASNAIDGRRSSHYNLGSCSHTAEDEADPWWRVDLKQNYIITAIKITNRGDCCAERLDGAEIRIGNSMENNGNDNPRCTSIVHIEAGKTNTYQCDGGNMEGRYVNVILPGTGKTLTLCEVEVFGTPAVYPLTNVALEKKAKQSTTFWFQYPGRGIRKCTDGYKYDCCTETLLSINPFWTVDLFAQHLVSAVTIINRKECCRDRLLGAQIWIEEKQHSSNKCGTVTSVDGGVVHTFHCAGMQGRFVTVFLPGIFKVLTLCEVEVYATPAVPEVSAPPAPTELPTAAPPLPSVSMVLNGRDVTVVGERLCWSDALLYCRRHHWDLLSVLSQDEQTAVEQLMASSPFPLTSYVWLGLRRSLTLSSWFWMSGDAVTFSKWTRGSPFFPSPCGGLASGGSHLWEEQPCEEGHNFICQSRAVDGGERVLFHSSSDA